jgi:hypothetical protein
MFSPLQLRARASRSMVETVDDIDIFDENGALTAAFLLSRGYCCGNGCRNCPYIPRHGGVEAAAPADEPNDVSES